MKDKNDTHPKYISVVVDNVGSIHDGNGLAYLDHIEEILREQIMNIKANKN